MIESPVLVCPHSSVVGGSQIIAVQVAARLQERGVDVAVYAPSGPLWDLVDGLGLSLFPCAEPGGRRWRRGLRVLCGRLGIGLVHAYEWAPILGAARSGVEREGVGLLGTVYSMDVPRFLPRHVPLLVGTGRLVEEARGYRDDVVLVPVPVDLDRDAPGSAEVPPERRSRALTLGVVGRLSEDLGKANGVIEAIGAVDVLAARRAVRLLVAGDGAAAGRVREAAAAVNARHGGGTVQLLGEVPDPRWVYEACDIVLGMGSSAARGMAHGKPTVVQGEDGFWLAVTPLSMPAFRREGFYGHGGLAAGGRVPTGGTAALLRELAPWLDDPAARAEAGREARKIAEAELGLDAAADAVHAASLRALAAPVDAATRARALARSALGRARFRGERVLGRWRA